MPGPRPRGKRSKGRTQVNNVSDHLDDRNQIKSFVAGKRFDRPGSHIETKRLAGVGGHRFVWFDADSLPTLVDKSLQHEPGRGADIQHAPWLDKSL